MTREPNAVQPIPEGYHTVTPWICSRDTAKLLDFMKQAFGAEELGRVYNEDGTIGHAEAKIGDSIVMGFDAKEEWPDTPCFLRLYVPDGDAVYQRALSAGATSVTEITSMFWGDRGSRVRDPFGNVWWITTHVENVAPQEMEKRAREKEYLDAMRYAQESFDHEMRSRRRK
jgi:PhnB protein